MRCPLVLVIVALVAVTAPCAPSDGPAGFPRLTTEPRRWERELEPPPGAAEITRWAGKGPSAVRSTSEVTCDYLGSPLSAWHPPDPTLLCVLCPPGGGTCLPSHAYSCAYDPASSTVTIDAPDGAYYILLAVDIGNDGSAWQVGDLYWRGPVFTLPAPLTAHFARYAALTEPVSSREPYVRGRCDGPAGAMVPPGPTRIAWEPFPELYAVEQVEVRATQQPCAGGPPSSASASALPAANQAVLDLAESAEVSLVVTFHGGTAIYGSRVELGMVVTSWLDAGRLLGGQVAYFRTGGPGTVVAGDEVTVSPTGVEVGARADAATDRTGNRAVVWSQPGSKGLPLAPGTPMAQGGAGIFGRLFDPEDQPLGDPITVATGTTAPLLAPTVAFNAEGGFVACWQAQGTGGGIFGRLFGPDLAPLTPVFQVTTGAAAADTPAVATASAGDFAVVWRAAGDKGSQGGSGVFGRFFDPDGGPKGDPVQVGGGQAVLVSAPAVATSAAGTSLVVWRQEGAKQGGAGVFGRLFDPTGEPTGAAVQLDGGQLGPVGPPSVAMDALGNAVAVWPHDLSQGDGFDVFARRLGSDGSPVGAPLRVNLTTAGDQTDPSVAMNPAGDIAVAWKGGDGIFGRFFTTGAVPLGPELEVALAAGGLEPVEPDVSLAPDDLITVAYAKVDGTGAGQGVFFRSLRVESPTGTCTADGTTVCLNGDRFEVQVSWRDFEDRTGVGQAVALTDDTGYFTFFNPANVEVVLKVLDGTVFNDHYWVFYGALSNVEYTIVVTDTQTGTSVVYFNPLGTFASVGDTSALPGTSAAVRRTVTTPPDRVSLRDARLYTRLVSAPPERRRTAVRGSCTPGPTSLCLNGSRFRVEVTWRDFQGRTGVGQALPLTADTGTFWFFTDTNVELILKVLDGRWLNGHYWLFYGALSNVEYTVTVTDTVTDRVRTYANPAGDFGSLGDTEAFPGP